MGDKHPTQEQIKKFWERLGIKASEDNGAFGYIKTYPEIDLNNLFNFAMPKLDYIMIKSFAKASFTSVKILHENQESYRQDKDPVLALFWAIWEVIHV